MRRALLWWIAYFIGGIMLLLCGAFVLVGLTALIALSNAGAMLAGYHMLFLVHPVLILGGGAFICIIFASSELAARASSGLKNLPPITFREFFKWWWEGIRYSLTHMP